MNRTNLIPLHRQLHDVRVARLRMWAWVAGGLCCLIVGALACCALGPSQANAAPAQEFSKAAGELTKANQEAAALRVELAAERERLRSRQLISDQPDYSLLLGLLSQQVDEDVVLNRCELGRGASSTDAAQAAQAASETLQLGGFARSQPAVAAFMLQLEATGIFKRVTLLRSNEQPLLSGQVAAFQIQCVLGPSEKGGQ